MEKTKSRGLEATSFSLNSLSPTSLSLPASTPSPSRTSIIDECIVETGKDTLRSTYRTSLHYGDTAIPIDFINLSSSPLETAVTVVKEGFTEPNYTLNEREEVNEEDEEEEYVAPVKAKHPILVNAPRRYLK